MANKGRSERYGSQRTSYEKNRERIFKTQRVCGICGQPVDINIKYPDPMSPCIDHIIPIAKGGHPSDIDNMQLAHWCCNRRKADKLPSKKIIEEEAISNRILPQSLDWKKYRADRGL